MKLIEHKSKFAHKSMSSWGVGVYLESDGDYISVEFENAGIKKFGKSVIGTMLIPVKGTTEDTMTTIKQSIAKSKVVSADSQSSSLIQFDGEHGGIAGKNIIEAFEGNDSVIFNETYMVVGEHTKAQKIHAMYDLTIIGDLTVQECVVNGSLTIIGDAHIAFLTCYNAFICKGNLYSDKIYVGRNMNVGSIDCDEIVCDGNVVLQTTANINQNAKIGKTIVACEGIMGAGKFSAVNAIANEYFEFDGEYDGKILELETDSTISDSSPIKTVSYENVEEIIELANKKLADEYAKCPNMDEDGIIAHLKRLGAIQSAGFKALPYVELLFSKLTEISYCDRIDSVDDYLLALTAKKILPDEVFNYESVDHIGKLFLPKAESEVAELTFEPRTIEQFSQVLSMAVGFENELSDDWKVLMDKIFESVGLKFSTVSSMIGRNQPCEDSQPKGEAFDEHTVSCDSNASGTPALTTDSRMKKTDFLGKKLSHFGKKYGLTDVELERLATIKIRTFGDFVKADDSTLTKVFGKKVFLVNHLIQTRDKIISNIADMD